VIGYTLLMLKGCTKLPEQDTTQPVPVPADITVTLDEVRLKLSLVSRPNVSLEDVGARATGTLY
jgi:hypothetical protein